jgi:hypothetical protein
MPSTRGPDVHRQWQTAIQSHRLSFRPESPGDVAEKSGCTRKIHPIHSQMSRLRFAALDMTVRTPEGSSRRCGHHDILTARIAFVVAIGYSINGKDILEKIL